MTASATGTNVLALELAWRAALHEWSDHWEAEDSGECPTPYCPTYVRLTKADRAAWRRWQRARIREAVAKP